MLKAIILLSLFLASSPIFAGELSEYYEFQQERDGIKLSGRVYFGEGGKLIVEAWPRPRSKKPTVEKIIVTSPSGKQYSPQDMQSVPMSRLGKKRLEYAQATARTGWDWWVQEAYANEEEAAPAEGSTNKEHERRQGESLLGFGLLAGVAGTMDKEWVSVNALQVEPEPGRWSARVVVRSENAREHTFDIPFAMPQRPKPRPVRTKPPGRPQTGIDLNGDGRVDNQLGNIIGALSPQTFDVENQVDESTATGDVLLLGEQVDPDAVYDSADDESEGK